MAATIGYKGSAAQRTAPYEVLFEECSQPETLGPLYSMGFEPSVTLIITQCDLAKAIANVTWVGPIACEQLNTLNILDPNF